MSIDNILGIASTAMNAQMVRLNSTASNMANASTVGSSAETAFKAKRPIFEALLREEQLTQNLRRIFLTYLSGHEKAETGHNRNDQ